MKALAIADHDVFDGQKEAILTGNIFNIDVVPAIEFYTDRPGVEIIGHFPSIDRFSRLLDSGDADKVIEPIRKAKKRQLTKMLKRIPDCFEKMNFTALITHDDIDQYLRNGISTKGDISVVMWQKYGRKLKAKGIAEDVKDFQAKYTTQDKYLNLPLEIDMDLSPKAFVERILQWGGLPGLSHPTELRKKEFLTNINLQNLITDLRKSGLQSLEVDGWRNGICPESGLHHTDLFDAMRLKSNEEFPDSPPLLFTNGSDDHNQPGEGLELGCGRNRNLRPEYGRYENIIALRVRSEYIFHQLTTQV